LKCPKCHLVTFDHLSKCPRCHASFALARRLTRQQLDPRRPILLPRDKEGPPSLARIEARDREQQRRQPIAPPVARPAVAPQATRHAPDPVRISAPGAANVPVVAASPPPDSQPAPARTTSVAAAEGPDTPTHDAQRADAALLKRRMVRASQARRQRRTDLATAQVDPILPDWYEPHTAAGKHRSGNSKHD